MRYRPCSWNSSADNCTASFACRCFLVGDLEPHHALIGFQYYKSTASVFERSLGSENQILSEFCAAVQSTRCTPHLLCFHHQAKTITDVVDKVKTFSRGFLHISSQALCGYSPNRPNPPSSDQRTCVQVGSAPFDEAECKTFHNIPFFLRASGFLRNMAKML